MPLILGTNSIKDTGYDVANSCRFNNGFNAGGDDAYMHRTPGSAGNRRTFTLSAWIKRGAYFNDEHPILAAADTTAIRFSSEGGSNSAINVFYYSGGWVFRVHTNAQYRDPSAWMHLVVAFDTTQGTASNRIKIYVNGNQVTSMGNSDYPSENYETQFNNNVLHSIARNANSNDYYEGYLSEVVMIDGQALDPTSFGEFDSNSGIWKPIDVSGLTFGTNGFYLDFKDSSNLGNDASGGTDFTEVNLSATDQSTDTCTNNFCTLNPLQAQIDGATLSEGNTKLVSTAGSPYTGTTGSTMAFNKGKWYHEVKYISAPSTTYPSVGFGEVSQVVTGSNKYLENAQGGDFNAISVSAARSTNNVYLTGSGNITYSGSDFPFSTNDILMVAIDYDNDKIWWGKNGTWLASGDPANGTNPSQSSFISAITPNDDYITPYFGDGNYVTSMTMEVNFGNPSFSISSGNSDGDGYGNFEYAVPSGYYALNTKNLAEYG